MSETPTVLCVDDNPALIALLVDVLDLEGFTTRAVLGGQECMDALKDGDAKPDIILLDILMEPMDGWMTLKEIRKEPSLSCVPVVMLTGKHPTMAEAEEFSPLMDGYLMKPFAIESFSQDVAAVLERVRRREELIKKARMQRADEESLAEYRRLSCRVSSLKQLANIIRNGSFKGERLQEAEGRLENLEKRLKAPLAMNA